MGGCTLSQTRLLHCTIAEIKSAVMLRSSSDAGRASPPPRTERGRSSGTRAWFCLGGDYRELPQQLEAGGRCGGLSSSWSSVTH